MDVKISLQQLLFCLTQLCLCVDAFGLFNTYAFNRRSRQVPFRLLPPSTGFMLNRNIFDTHIFHNTDMQMSGDQTQLEKRFLQFSPFVASYKEKQPKKPQQNLISLKNKKPKPGHIFLSLFDQIDRLIQQNNMLLTQSNKITNYDLSETTARPLIQQNIVHTEPFDFSWVKNNINNMFDDYSPEEENKANANAQEIKPYSYPNVHNSDNVNDASINPLQTTNHDSPTDMQVQTRKHFKTEPLKQANNIEDDIFWPASDLVNPITGIGQESLESRFDLDNVMVNDQELNSVPSLPDGVVEYDDPDYLAAVGGSFEGIYGPADDMAIGTFGKFKSELNLQHSNRIDETPTPSFTTNDFFGNEKEQQVKKLVIVIA